MPLIPLPLLLPSACSDKVAYDSLKAASWAVEPAIDFYFSSGLCKATPGVDPRAVEQLFNTYKGGLRCSGHELFPCRRLLIYFAKANTVGHLHTSN